MKPISLQLYSVREAAQSGFPGVLKQVADIGYKAVETAGMMDRTPSEYRALLDDVGLTVSSMHGGLPTPETVSDIVDTAKALGCDMVISGKGSADFKTLDGIRAVIPWHETGGRTERIGAAVAEGVPIRHGEPQVVGHRLAFDTLFGVVVLERQQVLRLGAFIFDRADAGECFVHRWVLLCLLLRCVLISVGAAICRGRPRSPMPAKRFLPVGWSRGFPR